MKDTYKTIETISESVFRDKGSRFIGMVFPVEDTETVKRILDEQRKQYHDARHHCYAYRLGPEGEEWRQNDDGEPSGSAGKPIHGQLLSYEVTHVLGLVVRYFGGTKLGIPGLIHAYRTAIREALEANQIIEQRVTRAINLRFGYQNMNLIMRIVKQESLEVITMESAMDCHVALRVRASEEERIISLLESLPGVILNE